MSRIFLAFGRNRDWMRRVREFLVDLGFEVDTLEGSGSGTQGLNDLLIKRIKRSDHAVVVMTADDVGGRKSDGLNTTPRARQNVIYELGICMAFLGGPRVSLLMEDKDVLRDFSDAHGLLFISLKGDWRRGLLADLQAVGALPRLEKAITFDFDPRGSLSEKHLVKQTGWLNALESAEAEPGDRFLVKAGLSSLTQTGGDHRRQIKRAQQKSRKPLAETRIDEMIRTYERRYHLALKHLESWQFRHICPMNVIQNYATTGWSGLEQPHRGRVAASPATPAERRRRLMQMLDLMAHHRYHVALVDEEFVEQHMSMWWEVKFQAGKDGRVIRGHVFREIWNPLTESEVREHVVAPWLVDGYRRYFLSLWNKVPDRQRHRGEVRSYVEEALERIPLARRVRSDRQRS